MKRVQQMSKMNHWIVRSTACVMCCWGLVAQAAAPDTAVPISERLFPTTRSWVSVAATPVLKKERLAAVRAQLKSGYLASKSLGEFESPDCSFIQRALDDEGSSFHVVDINGDGLDDIIYTGPALCAEGSRTVVWYLVGGKYALTGDQAWSVRALKIRPGKSPSISSVAAGCCADPMDEYHLGEFTNIRMQGSVKVTKDTVHPESSLASPKAFKSLREIALRSAPAASNAYDEGRSQMMAHAIFGNILSRFLQGASGSVLAEREDKSGVLWAYVRIESDSDALRKDAPYLANVGWVEMKDLRIGK